MTEHQWHAHYLRFRTWKENRAKQLALDVFKQTGVDVTQRIFQLMDDIVLLKIYEQELSEKNESNIRTSK